VTAHKGHLAAQAGVLTFAQLLRRWLRKRCGLGLNPNRLFIDEHDSGLMPENRCRNPAT
jgi:hypothetical protein